MTARIKETFQGVYPDRWANGKKGYMRYNSENVWYQYAELPYEGTTPRQAYQDISELENTVKFPIVATGITAYVLRRMNRVPGEKIYTDYYEACLSKFKDVEKLKPDAFIRDLDSEFYSIHLREETDKIKESEVVFSYTTIEETAQIGEFVKNYFEYIEKNYHCPINKNNEVSINESIDTSLNIDPEIFVPIVNEDIVDDLFKKIKNYFKPEDQFLNFLKGNKIEGKINFTGNQNQIAGIFIKLRLDTDIKLGTHKQTYYFIKQTFLIKGKPIRTDQIFSYLKDSSKANQKTFIDISI